MLTWINPKHAHLSTSCYFTHSKYLHYMNKSLVVLFLVTSALACQRAEEQNQQGVSLTEALDTNTILALTPEQVAFYPEAQLRGHIEEAMRYIENHIDQQGRFVYQTNLQEKAAIDPDDYNMLRHMGTVYAMGQVQKTLGGSAQDQLIRRACQYVRTCCLDAFPPSEIPAVGMVSDPAISDSRAGRRIKLGGNGLALLGFLAAQRQDEQFMAPDTLTMIARSIRAMQLEDGSFKSLYSLRHQRYSDFNSLFYPGEAMLGLIQLYRYDQNEAWLDIVVSGLRAIALQRQELSIEELPTDHWILIATAELLEEVPERYYAADKQMFLGHARRIALKMLQTLDLGDRGIARRGSFDRSKSATVTGTRLEGMLAMAPHLSAYDPQLEEVLRMAIHLGLHYVAGAQVQTGPLRGGVTGVSQAIYGIRQKPDRSDTQIQIDHVQHVMSGWAWAVERRDWLYDNQ